MIDQFHPQQIVATGYDHVSASYTAWARSVRIAERQHYMQVIWDHVATGGDVLDLGCATGALTSGQLTERFNLTGVDISPRQIELARQQLPDSTFLCADMTKVTFAPSSFDAVVAFYSIIHVPQAEQPMLFRNIAMWLRPGGLFVAALTATETEFGYDDDWLGAPMFWSGFDTATNVQLIKETGLEILSATEETEEEMEQPITFLWVVARKGEEGQPLAIGGNTTV